jgi:nitrite reductase (NO-forming)
MTMSVDPEEVTVKRLHVLALAAPTLALVALGFAGAGRSPERVTAVDFAKVVTPTQPTYAAAVPPVSDAPIKEFRIPIKNATITIADGVTYNGWTFGGTVPGPVLHVRQGDLVRIRLVNEAPMPHSIDFHAARIPMNVAYRSIGPNDSLSFEFTARDPGVFLVHCGTPPVMLHIMQGMYMAIIVDPAGGWPTKADRQFLILQSEFYADKPDSGTAQPDWKAALDKDATYVVFNGRAFQYQQTPLQVDEGDRVRLFVVNAGPNYTSDFHIVGAIFDRVYPDGDPAHALAHVQTYPVPAGGGVVFETTFAKDGSGAGSYAFVTHAFADATKGAVGVIHVNGPQRVAATR